MKTYLSSKLHPVTVTATELNYDGSIAIDTALLQEAGIEEFEQVHCYNMTNGKRWITYAILAEDGVVSVNGAGARNAYVGDQIIICAYQSWSDVDALQPKMVYLDHKNKVIAINSEGFGNNEITC